MSNPIGWCDLTLNPLTGCTNFNTQHCGNYCYAARMAKRLAGRFGYPEDEPFRPTFHKDVLNKIGKIPGTGKRVFLNSMGDWFCEIRNEWVYEILDQIFEVLYDVPQHHFLVLTKRPERIMEVLHCRNLPPNLWLGVTVTCKADLWRISMLKESIPSATKRFVSFEPLLGPVYQSGQMLGGVDWVIIGAQTGPGKVVPETRWLEDLFGAIPVSIPVYQKDNIQAISPVGNYKQFPEAML